MQLLMLILNIIVFLNMLIPSKSVDIHLCYKTFRFDFVNRVHLDLWLCYICNQLSWKSKAFAISKLWTTQSIMLLLRYSLNYCIKTVLMCIGGLWWIHFCNTSLFARLKPLHLRSTLWGPTLVSYSLGTLLSLKVPLVTQSLSFCRTFLSF
jgi:hypothetical protein